MDGWAVGAFTMTAMSRPVENSKQITGGSQNSGIAVIPKHKEVMIASALQNKVLTFYFPELFD